MKCSLQKIGFTIYDVTALFYLFFVSNELWKNNQILLDFSNDIYVWHFFVEN